jgi:hypothetical protein
MSIIGHATAVYWHLFPILIGVNTNAIENAWMQAKRFMRKKKVSSDQSLHEHLQVYMWRLWKGMAHAQGCFHRLISDISIIYLV